MALDSRTSAEPFARQLARVVTMCLLWGWLGLTSILPLAAHEGHRPLPTRGMEVDPLTGKMVLTRSARETLDVQTVEVAKQPMSQSVLAYGTLASPWNRHAMVSSPLAGRIVKLLVSPGETVRMGQLLAEVESPDLELLQLELRTAQTELQLSAKLVAGLESTTQAGAVPKMRLLEAEFKAQQDLAALEIAKAKWIGLRLSADSLTALLSEPGSSHPQRLSLTSPLNGVVTHTDLSVGKVVDPQEHLFEVLDLTTVWLKIGVLEKDLSLMAVGQSLDLTLSAYPDETFSGQVDVLGQFLDPQTHLGTVWATLSNSNISAPRLLPGMSGQVQLHVGGAEDRLVVPQSAVIRDGAERFVLVEEEQTQAASIYQKQTVVLGRRMGGLIEVRGGNLYPSDRVVTRGSHELGSFFTKGVLTVSAETARDIGLQVEATSLKTLDDIITIDGIVDVPPTRRAVAASQIAGSIQRILVDRGQPVRQGDVIAEIVSQEFQTMQLDMLRADLDARLQQTASENLKVAGDSVSQRRKWEVESQLNQAQNRRDTVQQRLKTAGLSEEQLRDLVTTKTLVAALPVRAPIDGVIVEFDKVLGHVIRADESLFEIHDLSQAWVQGFVSERDLPHVRVGQSVRVRFVADAAHVVSGILVRTGRSVGREDRTLAVWIELKEMPRVPVQHNMLARVTIQKGSSRSRLAVPRDAVVREGTSAFVFVQKLDRSFERRAVQLGRADDALIEIRDGLVAGDPVAVSGAVALQTGYAALR